MAEQRKDGHGEWAPPRMIAAHLDAARSGWQDQAFLEFLRANMTFGCHRCDKTVRWDELKVPAPTVDEHDTATFHLYCSDACADLGCVPEHCEQPRVPT